MREPISPRERAVIVQTVKALGRWNGFRGGHLMWIERTSSKETPFEAAVCISRQWKKANCATMFDAAAFINSSVLRAQLRQAC